MILSKLICLTSYRSTTVILREYSAYSKFRPLIMPKDNRLHLMELQKQRRKQKAQAAKYIPSHIYLQVIANGTRAESRSVLLVTDHTNYLFNCGEGTQRLASEHHARLTKIEHVFVTKPTWENMGGVPGVALTIQDTGVPKINIHGPEGTIDILEAIDNFVTLDKLEVVEADISQQFSDQTMAVTYITINNPNPEQIEPVKAQMYTDSVNYYDYQLSRKRPRSPPNKQERQSMRNTNMLLKSRLNSMMIYACKVHPRAGTLNMEKCAQLGIPTGPLLGKLKAGHDITLPGGEVIHSKDMVAPPEKGPLFLVLECPDENWIDAIVNNQDLLKYQKETATKEENIASCILHFTPTNILNNPKYKEWMDKFGPDCQHLVINEDNTGFASEAMHKMQHQLHLIHPTIFPFFKDQQNFVNQNGEMYMKKAIDEIPTEISSMPENENDEEAVQQVKEDERYHRCKTLHMFHMRPHKGLDTEISVQIHPRSYVQEVFEVDGFLDSLADLQTELNAKTKSLGDIEEYPKILMLGTGSSIPNKVRNTSGILLQLDEERSIVLDCGEGSLGQIMRFFGEVEGDKVLKSIKAIYVSHLHADHHLGLIRILKERERVTDEPLFLLAPQQISSYLHFYHNRFESILQRFRLISNRDLIMNQNILSAKVSQDLYEALNIGNISTCYVTHCPFSYGLALTLKDGRKICYSGDTVPCDNMVKLAQDSFLLIHEATMEDGLENEAVLKRHSTISQAINIGVKANADFTFLTHFSQRYSKIPVLPSKKESGIDFNRVGIAYDFMQFSLSQLPLLPLFYHSLGLMFSDFRAMLEERANRREWKKEQEIKEASN